MKQKLSHEALAQLFEEARTFNKFTDRAVTDEVIVQLKSKHRLWRPVWQLPVRLRVCPLLWLARLIEFGLVVHQDENNAFIDYSQRIHCLNCY